MLRYITAQNCPCSINLDIPHVKSKQDQTKNHHLECILHDGGLLSDLWTTPPPNIVISAISKNNKVDFLAGRVFLFLVCFFCVCMCDDISRR